MIVSAKQYAKLLFELTKNKSNDEIDQSVYRFVRLLARNNQIRIVRNIIDNFSEISDKNNSTILAHVSSAFGIDVETEEKIKSIVSKKYGFEKVAIESKIVPEIKGGIIIRVGDEILDGSVSGQIEKMRMELDI
jgi:ATP synthase F1 delta subunit